MRVPPSPPPFLSASVVCGPSALPFRPACLALGPPGGMAAKMAAEGSKRMFGGMMIALGAMEEPLCQKLEAEILVREGWEG